MDYTIEDLKCCGNCADYKDPDCLYDGINHASEKCKDWAWNLSKFNERALS
jgi:hypothetical protein